MGETPKMGSLKRTDIHSSRKRGLAGVSVKKGRSFLLETTVYLGMGVVHG